MPEIETSIKPVKTSPEIKNPKKTESTVSTTGFRIDLFEKFPLLKRIVQWRSFQFLLILPNMVVFYLLRPFASEIKIKSYDEVWKGFIMLALAMAYSVILLGTNGTIKDWANVTETQQWGGFAVYALILWSTALVILPAIFYLAVRIAKKMANAGEKTVKEVFIGYAYVLVPLGLLAWIAFSVPLLFVNGSYIVSVISDPLGWGWDLFGTANVHWQPIIPEYLGLVQIGLLLIGFFYAVDRGFKIGINLFGDQKMALRGLIPIGSFSLLVTVAFMRFFIG